MEMVKGGQDINYTARDKPGKINVLGSNHVNAEVTGHLYQSFQQN